MKLEEMSAEKLVSNHERLCEIYFLRDDDIDEELRNSFKTMVSRLTRGEKAIKAMEKIDKIYINHRAYDEYVDSVRSIIEQYRRKDEPTKLRNT